MATRSAVLFLPAFEGRAHFRFWVDAQRVSNAVDVVEITDDFNRVQDVAVAEAMFAKDVQVLFADGSGGSRDKIGKFSQGFAARR